MDRKETVQDVLKEMRECRACFFVREAEQDDEATCDPCGWALDAQQAKGE